MTVHGGDVWDLHIPVSEILDFSANINPRGLPDKARSQLLKDACDNKLLSFYPDPAAIHLRAALSKQLHCAPDSIVVGSGAESLLSPIIRGLGARRALVPIPAFSEYRRVCQQEQLDYMPFPLARENEFRIQVDSFCHRIQNTNCDVVFLNNPHNPSGSLLLHSEVRDILQSAQARSVPLILDEAFIDYVEAESLVQTAAETPGLIVIRSLTKFYGCPALRVGYAVAHPDTIRRIRLFVPTWPVTLLAMNALAEAITDTSYAESSIHGNERERNNLSRSLSQLGCKVFSSAANYLLLELSEQMPSASELRSRLISDHKILIRNCDSYEGLETGRYVRVAVRSAAENQRLLQAMSQEFNTYEADRANHK